MQQVLNLHDSLKTLQVGKCLFVVFTLRLFVMEKNTSTAPIAVILLGVILNQLKEMFHQDRINCHFVKERKHVWEAP